MSFYDIMTLIGAVVVTMLMLALVYYASRWYAKRMNTGGGGRYVRVLDKAVMGQNSAIYVVKAGKRCFLLGVADKSVTKIAELDDFEEADTPPNPAIPFSSVLGKALNKQERPR